MNLGEMWSAVPREFSAAQTPRMAYELNEVAFGLMTDFCLRKTTVFEIV